MSESHPSLRTIFNEAVEIADPQRRADYLASACGVDTVLRQRLEELLAANNESGRFLGGAGDTAPHAGSNAPGGAALVSPITEKEGDKIGRYKLLQQIGEGGCGVVYMAEQEQPMRRRVALKVIKLGMDTKSVIARFEAERQALALMDHPNIAKVLDAGATDAGRPYFVMELVKGVRITDYCDQNNLSTRQRLDLFTRVCHAIQHAHQKGIIHRDIKPSNILVTMHDGMPVPKVIDFGIAKATDQRLTEKTLFTQLDQFMGTPAYMSPEQVELSGLDIDTRTDIYSLGVLLYQLLTGKTPFDAKELLQAGFDEMRRKIREDEPQRPSTRISTLAGSDLTTLAAQRQADPHKLTKLLHGDLDWIVMKALEKDRTRRYDTANAFALDIRCFLADEPVSAAAPSAAYRFGKFARRNKAGLGVAAAIAAILIAATAASTWQAIRATQAEELANRQVIRTTAAEEVAKKRVLEVVAERDAKDKARQDAEIARQDAEAIANFLTRVFQSPNPAVKGRTITVAETLDHAARKLDTDLASQPAVRAKLQNALGNTYRALGMDRDAIPLLEKARDYYLATMGTEHSFALGSMNNLAASYANAGRRDEALKLQEEVVALMRKVYGPEHPDTLGTMGNLAGSYHDVGRRDEALKLKEEVEALMRKVNGPEHPNTLKAMQNLAGSYHDAGRQNEALKLLEEVLLLSRKVNGPEHPGTLSAMHDLAVAYRGVGRDDEALKLLEEEVLPLSRKVNGPEHRGTLAAMNTLGASYHSAGRSDEALKLWEEALLLSRKVLGPEHPDTLSRMSNVAVSYGHAGRLDEALKMEDEVLTLSRKANGPEHPRTLWAMNNLAASYANAGRRDEAIRLQEEVVALMRKVLGPDHPSTLKSMRALAESYASAGRRDEAIQLGEGLAKTEALGSKLEESQPQRADNTSPASPGAPSSDNQKYSRADSYYRQGRYAQAEPLYRQLLQSQLKLFPATNETALSIAASLARNLSDWAWTERDSTNKAGAYDHAVEAERLLRDCFDVRRRGSNANIWRTLDVKSRFGFALLAIAVTDGKSTPEARAIRLIEAEPLLLESAAGLQTEVRVSSAYKRDSLKRLVRLYQAWPKPDEAAEWRNKLEAFDKADGERTPQKIEEKR